MPAFAFSDCGCVPRHGMTACIRIQDLPFKEIFRFLSTMALPLDILSTDTRGSQFSTSSLTIGVFVAVVYSSHPNEWERITLCGF